MKIIYLFINIMFLYGEESAVLRLPDPHDINHHLTALSDVAIDKVDPLSDELINFLTLTSSDSAELAKKNKLALNEPVKKAAAVEHEVSNNRDNESSKLLPELTVHKSNAAASVKTVKKSSARRSQFSYEVSKFMSKVGKSARRNRSVALGKKQSRKRQERFLERRRLLNEGRQKNRVEH